MDFQGLCAGVRILLVLGLLLASSSESQVVRSYGLTHGIMELAQGPLNVSVGDCVTDKAKHPCVWRCLISKYSVLFSKVHVLILGWVNIIDCELRICFCREITLNILFKASLYTVENFKSHVLIQGSTWIFCIAAVFSFVKKQGLLVAEGMWQWQSPAGTLGMDAQSCSASVSSSEGGHPIKLAVKSRLGGVCKVPAK